MIEEKLTIDMLTQDSVSILKQRFYIENGTSTQLGQNHRKAYTNSVNGRKELVELPQNVQNSILAMWGNAPTVTENTVI